jgi:hypothetical protein
VSIIIVNWNTKELLQNCLTSVYKQAGSVNYEVIVIDNGSTDGSPEMVSNDFPQVILVRNLENKGFAAANNQGITIAKGRYVLLLNSDTVILNSALSKTVAFADAHLEAAVVGCRVLNPDRTLQPTCFMFPSLLNTFLSSTYLYKLFPKSRFFGRERMTWWDRGDTREVDVVTGCFMLVRREAIEQVGLMDERFFMYGEETDWCYRFKKAGWRVVFAPVAEIVHLGGQSTSQRSGEMIVELRLNILNFIRKHQGYLTYIIARLLTIFFFGIRIPFWFLIGLFVSENRKQPSVKMRAYLNGIGKIIFCQG